MWPKQRPVRTPSILGVLSDHGIDRARLESFDRAVTLPEFFADKKAPKRTSSSKSEAQTKLPRMLF